MSRGWDDDRTPDVEQAPAVSRGSNGADATAHRPRAEEPRVATPSTTILARDPERARPIIWRDRTVTLSPSVQRTLHTVGTFRTVAVDDLVRSRYAGDYARFERDLRPVLRRGWMVRRT